MTQIPNPRGGEPGLSNVGILILQSETSDFAQRLRAQSDHSIITIEGTDSSATKKLREEYLSLQGRCEKIFVVSVGIGSVSALAIGEEFTDQIDGIIIIDPISSSANRSSRKEYKDVFENLDLIEHPLLLMYSLGDTGEKFTQAQEIAENISSAYIREVVLTDGDESASVSETILFISEVGHGFWPSSIDDDTDLIDAEFESIVAGLSLDESSPTNYLDNLDLLENEEHFIEPNPELLPIHSRVKRNSIYAMIAGPIYAVVAAVTGFNPLGVEPWPGVIAFFGGLAGFLYSLRDDFTDEDGAIL